MDIVMVIQIQVWMWFAGSTGREIVGLETCVSLLMLDIQIFTKIHGIILIIQIERNPVEMEIIVDRITSRSKG